MTTTPYAKIWCDGSIRRNPGGAGGWAFVGRRGTEMFEKSGGEFSTTNNRMEMMACIQALEYLPAPEKRIRIVSDSQYVVRGVDRLPYWKGWGWVTGQFKDKVVANRDLWERMDAAIHRHVNVEFQWVRGHAGNVLNERADYLAGKAMRRYAAMLDARASTG